MLRKCLGVLVMMWRYRDGVLMMYLCCGEVLMIRWRNVGDVLVMLCRWGCVDDVVAICW